MIFLSSHRERKRYASLAESLFLLHLAGLYDLFILCWTVLHFTQLRHCFHIQIHTSQFIQVVNYSLLPVQNVALLNVCSLGSGEIQVRPACCTGVSCQQEIYKPTNPRYT